MTDKLSVIIPFYQEQPGILRRAVESVCAQTGVSDVEVIVVDDGSPVRAHDEMCDFSATPAITVRIIEQKNAGPGAARNTGLDNVTNDTEYIAFLDSDDEWTRDHLFRAIAALTNRYDFYFSDYLEVGQIASAYSRKKLIDPASHTLISVLDNIYEYEGDFFRQQIIHVLPYTSTVVYKNDKFGAIRFSKKFRFACEDNFCWVEIAATEPKVVFSMQSECRIGRGVNIFQASKWGTKQALRVLYYNAVYEREIQKKFNLDDELKAVSIARLKVITRDFASNLLHVLRHREVPSVRILFCYYTLDPASIWQFFATVCRIVAAKIRSPNM